MPTSRTSRVALVPSMRVVAALAVVLLIASQAAAQGVPAASGLLGDVASVLEYREYPGTTDRQLITERTYGPGGVPLELVVYRYSFTEVAPVGRTVTSYDDAGLRLATVVYDADGTVTAQTVYRYDDAGAQVAEVTVDAQGNETRRVDQELDANGRPLLRVVQRDGVVRDRFESTFDAQGRPLEVRRLDGEGRLRSVQTYSDPGRAFDYVEYDEDGAITERGTSSDGEHGPASVVAFDGDGEPAYEIHWRYDDAGREIERRYAEADDVETTYRTTYELDDVGNWVRLEVTEDWGSGPEPYEIRERVISYR